MDFYGPHKQVKHLFKAFLFLTHKKNIIIYSQMIFQLYQSHHLTAIGLQSGKSYRLKIFHRLTVHVEVITTTVTDLSNLPLLSYWGKYGKNVKINVYGLYGPQKLF